MANAQILLVEDESIVAKGIQHDLRSMGYDVPVIASSAEEAIEKTKEVVQMEGKLNSELLTPKMSGAQVASIKLMLESIRRAAEYGSDIAEVAIDLTVAEPSSV